MPKKVDDVDDGCQTEVGRTSRVGAGLEQSKSGAEA